LKIERRYFNAELRVKKTDDGKKIAGYATKFAPGAMSEDLGGFREQIHPNAFNKCLTANPDVRCLWNHDPNHILGRTTAGTLRLSTDNTGLQYECDPPDTQMARDLMTSMERGDVSQSSFGFVCTDDDWRQDIDGGVIRTVLQAELFDVSPVTYPAYPSATSGVRSEVRDMMNPDSLAKFEEIRANSDGPHKTVDGEVLHADAFLIVGDKTDPETWHLPWKFSTEEKTLSHLRDALARFDQVEGVSADAKKTAWDKLVSLCKKHGIAVSEDGKEKKSAVNVDAELRIKDDDTTQDFTLCDSCRSGICAHCTRAYETFLDEDNARSAPADGETRKAGDAQDADPAAPIATDSNDPGCECRCERCAEDDCANCSDTTCNDGDCTGCPMQDDRAARALRQQTEDEDALALIQVLMLRNKLSV